MHHPDFQGINGPKGATALNNHAYRVHMTEADTPEKKAAVTRLRTELVEHLTHLFAKDYEAPQKLALVHGRPMKDWHYLPPGFEDLTEAELIAAQSDPIRQIEQLAATEALTLEQRRRLTDALESSFAEVPLTPSPHRNGKH